VRKTEYYWRTRDGNIPHTTSPLGDGSLELADCYFDNEDEATRYYEKLDEQGYLDDIDGATLYDTKGRKIMEGTEVLTDQSGIMDF
jgi:hypothetical protein